MSILKKFHIAVLGAAEVGKTSLVARLGGLPFNRKSGYKPSTTEAPVRTSIEVVTSAGLLLFHFYDWAWVEQRKEIEVNVFNQHIAAGHDGAVFMYSVTSKESRKDFEFFYDWYERAAGFDKPWLIISSKNDQKKRQVNDEEGRALANKGNRRSYVPVSLVDDTGVDDVVVSLARIMLSDTNLTVSTTRLASEEALQWSVNRRASLLDSIHNEAAAQNVDKTTRVLCLIPNKSVFEKFEQSLIGSVYHAEQAYGVDGIEEELVAMNLKGPAVEGAAPEASHLLPIGFLVVPPSASESQQNALKALGTKYSVPCVVTIPKNVCSDLQSYRA